MLHSLAYHYASRDGVDSILSLGLFPVDYDLEKPIFFFPPPGAPFSLLVRRSWCSMEPKEKRNPGTWQNMPVCLALDVALLLYHGLRLMETTAGSVITGDWGPNLLASPTGSSMNHKFIYANHSYCYTRVDFNKMKAEGRSSDKANAPTSLRYPEPLEDNSDMWQELATKLREK